MRHLLLVTLLIGICAKTTGAAPADGVVADFENTASQKITTTGLSITESKTGAAAGVGYISLSSAADAAAGKAELRLPLPAGADPAGHEKLSVALRAPQAAAPIDLRWLALDAASQPIFQRRFKLAAGEQWVRLDEPLRSWRWDNGRVGDWDEVKTLVLSIASPGAVKQIDLDDVRFTGQETIEQRTEWLLKVAFETRPHKQASGDGLLVATDATDVFTDADLNRQLQDMRRARAFVRRAFGDAVRPTDQQNSPVALLIFKDADQYPAFVQRFGKELNVTISPPTAGGYTVQDVASSTYKPDQGPRRPVYLHESIHAMVARDVRLIPGNPPHNALQEAIANYVQIVVFPKSIDRGVYVKYFAQPIDPAGGGVFRPLETLFTQRVTTKEYAQLASVFAYLLEKDPTLLRDLANGLASGNSASDVLQQSHTSWKQVQDAWIAWGRQRFAAGTNRNAPIFATPPELR